MDLTVDLFAFFVLSVVIYYVLKWSSSKGKQGDIPGPGYGFPILGHIPLLGMEAWHKFAEWRKIYGPVFKIRMGCYDVVVLNDAKSIKEAFNQQSLSGRPHFEVFKRANQGRGIVFSDGPLVQEQRKFALKNLRGFGLATKAREERIQEEISQVLTNLEGHCGESLKSEGLFCTSIVNALWSLFMGRRFELNDPRPVYLAEGVKALTTNEGPLVVLSMFLPFIGKYLPRISGLEKQLNGFKRNYEFVQEAFKEPNESRVEGKPRNFKEAFLDEVDRVGDDLGSSFHPSYNFFPYTAGDIFMGSIETVSTTITWFLLYMIQNREVQVKAQEEIDEKIGTRMPELADKLNTPYIDALVQELLRCSSITPLSGMMHRAYEDTKLGEFTIPKDALQIGNVYGVHYDPEVWGDPDNFRPERFLTEEGKLDKNLMAHLLPFSTGKRYCVGEGLARDQVYLYCSSILQRFNIQAGGEIKLGCTTGIVRTPLPFRVVFIKRRRE